MDKVPERYNASVLLDANIIAGRGDNVALWCAEEKLTYRTLLDRVCAMGRALQALGVGREDRVLLLLDDTLAFPVAFFGAIRIGAVPVPVNPLYKAADYRFFVQDSYARLIVTEHAYRDKLTQALDGLVQPPPIIVVGDEGTPGTHALEALLAANEGELSPLNTHRDDMAFWLYSSGSTGTPKGVVHLHRDIPYTCRTYARHVWNLTQDDIVFARVLFHAYGLGNALSFPFAVGASTVLLPGRPTPQRILETLQRFRPTVFCAVPTLYNAILNDPGSAQADLSSLRLCISAAEPLPPQTWQRWQETFHMAILDGIGSTEMLHIFCSNSQNVLRPGSSGKPVPGYRLKILDDAGQVAAVGEVGDLYVSGGSAAPFYWHHRDKSQQTMRGEWMFTGDRYRVDEDGFYWYEGRSDDMIKVSGEWVSPIEMENVLLEHPAVQEAAVVGLPVDGLMRIRAVIVLTSGQHCVSALVPELQDWCKTRLQRYQYPHRIDFVLELPKTITGKIQRFKLREARA